MLVKALKSFAGRYGHIRAGTTFECEPNYFTALRRNGMVAEVTDGTPGEPGPTQNRSVPAAPRTSGKDQPGQQGENPGSTEPLPDAGADSTSSSLRADLASRQKTSRRSGAGVTTRSIRRKPKESSDPPPAE